MRRHHRRWKRTRTALAAAGVASLGGVALAGGAAVGAGAEVETASYEAVAAADGVRFSVGAPGFVAVDTFIDGGGPVAQSIIDGLGNSRAFAALPYPGDLAISGPGLLAGLTGLPSPPPYPFYVDSSHPTKAESKLTQPGYELVARSAEQGSESSAMTGGTSGGSAIGSTLAQARTVRDPATGAVTGEATGRADVINIGGVLRIGQVDALAKVTRTPGGEPVRESRFVINGMTIAGQTVGISEKGFTFGGTTTPIPAGNPLLEALAQAKITVTYLSGTNNPDGVVSPGLVVRQEQQVPSGPTMVLRYVFGQMSASATVSGSATSVGSDLPVDTPVTESPVIEGPADTAPPAPAPAPVAPVVERPPATASVKAPILDDSSLRFAPNLPVPDLGSEGTAPAAAYPAPVQLASPISQVPVTNVDTLPIYIVLVVGAGVALGGGLFLRMVGVKLKWTS